MNVENAIPAETKPTLIKRALSFLGIDTCEHEWEANDLESLRTCKCCSEHQYKSFTYDTWRTFVEPR